jgi:general secretion pathway protein I
MTRRLLLPEPAQSDGKNTPESGFTLLETLIALTILSLSVAVLFGIFSTSLDRAREDRQATEARVLAQRLLAAAQVGSRTEAAQGTDSFGLHWTVKVAPVNRTDGSVGEPQAANVSATVRWTSNGFDRSLTLSSLTLLLRQSREPS